MPNKYPNKKGWTIPKQKYKVSHWREYNQFYISTALGGGYIKLIINLSKVQFTAPP
ncbi:hypothetical protein [Candidiatus Paracoxiella cheracis]|uniref:hypothetical protein n=1 Tax=Candidiatus Paracoxiella cheracis TaxID=3405120 RepID=UPI003BF5900A